MILHTSLSIDECRSRLASAIDEERWSFSLSGYLGSKSILGNINGDEFRLQKRIFYRNNLRPFFFGKFVNYESGTLIEGEFKMPSIVRWLMIYGFSFLVFFLIISIAIILVSLAMGRSDVRDNIVFVVFPLGMMAFGIFLVKFSRWLCRGDENAIIAFLKDALQASE